MQKVIVKMTAKYQATIPKEIRDILHLKIKDHIVYEVLENNTVVLRKAQPLDIDYLNALKHTLNEWDSPEDDEAYKNL